MKPNNINVKKITMINKGRFIANSVTDMIFYLFFFDCNQFTNGFSNMENIIAKERGTNTLRKIYSTNINSTTPKRLIVALK